MRRSTITAGTSTVALLDDGVDDHAPEELVHLRLGGLVEAPLRRRRAARRCVSNSLTPIARSSSSSGSSFSCTCLTVTA